MSFSLENIDERKAAQNRSRAGDDGETNWWPLVRAAFLAALTGFLVKLVALGWMAQQNDVSLEVRFWKGFVPHLGMQIPPADFAHIVTWSTFVMALATTVFFAIAVLSSKLTKMVVWGWFMGVFVSLETFVLELLRHLLEPPVVETSIMWRTFIPLGAGVALAVAYALITREKREKAVPTVPVARAVFTSPEGSVTVDTRPGAAQTAPPVAMPQPVTPEPSVFEPDGPEPTAPDRVPAYAAAAVPVAAAAAVADPPPAPAPEPRPETAAALAAAASPNRIVDARPAANRDTTPNPQPDAPAPIVDARPAALANGNGTNGSGSHGTSNGTSPDPSDDAPEEPKPIVDARPAAQRDAHPV